jgi:peptidoglycan/xylan/chitin deacetylase (PgdA/CDA1 family)
MVGSGLCELASHSVTHRYMTALPDDEALDELSHSREVIETNTGVRPEAFFYPLGAHNRRIRRLTKRSGYRAAFVAHGGPTLSKTPRYWIPRYDVRADLPLRTFRSFFNHEIRVSHPSRSEPQPTVVWKSLAKSAR